MNTLFLITIMVKFKVRLLGSKAPITVKNFDYLVKKGFYNGVTFHRVIEGFMIQGGIQMVQVLAVQAIQFLMNFLMTCISTKWAFLPWLTVVRTLGAPNSSLP